MATNPTKQNPTAVQVLDEQKRRLSTLQDRRTRVQVRLETEKAALTTASAEAQAQFGTSELDSLRQIYKDRLAENDRVVMNFMLDLDSVEQQLSDIERQIKL